MTKTKVMLELPDGMIEMGKELKLKCKSLKDIPPHKSRQWRGGEDNKLLCYDGVTIDSQKYKEEIKSSTAYELTVKKVSESDLQCPYACRIGFDIDQKFLNVNEENFIHMPNRNATNFIYERQNGTFRLSFELQKVYPKPVCMVISNGASKNLTVTDEVKSRVLLNVTYGLESDEPLHKCWEPITIECLIGKRTHTITTEHTSVCQTSQPNEETGTLTSGVAICLAFVMILLMLILSAIYIWKRSMTSCGDIYVKVRRNDIGL